MNASKGLVKPKLYEGLHHVLPKTLSRRHARKQFDTTLTTVVAAVHWRHYAHRHAESDLAKPLLEEKLEQGKVQSSREQQKLNPLIGSWIDISVTRNYAEYFSVLQEADSLGYTEIAQNGKAIHAKMQSEDTWMIATLPTRTIRLRLRAMQMLDFEYMPNGGDRWIESQAVKLDKVATLDKPPKVVLNSKKGLALLLMALLAIMDGVCSWAWMQGRWNKFYRDNEWHPVPTARGECFLPAPQPFYLEVSGALVRTFVTSTVLSVSSVSSWADEYPCQGSQLDSVKYHGARWYLLYQIVSVPTSLSMVVYHWGQTATDDFNCLFAMITNSPYLLNAMASGMQCVISWKYICHMQSWACGAKHRVERWRVGKGGFAEEKQKYLLILAALNAFLIGPPTLILLLVYIIPSLLQPIILVQFLCIIFGGVVISWLLGAAEFWQLAMGKSARGECLKRLQYCAVRAISVASNSLSASDKNKQLAKELEEMALATSDQVAKALEERQRDAQIGWTYAIFYFMPAFVASRVAFEVAFVEIMHTRAGLNSWEATQVTWTERRINVFVASLVLATQATLWHCWSGSQFLLEWL